MASRSREGNVISFAVVVVFVKPWNQVRILTNCFKPLAIMVVRLLLNYQSLV